MKAPVRWLVGAMLWLCAAQSYAGTACTIEPIDPAALAEAAQTALTVRAALDERNEPLALVARVGTDLSKHDLVYSHIALMLRDDTPGRWHVVHLLNRCGTERSELYREGLVNFFADDLVRQDARIIWLTREWQHSLLDALAHGAARAVHEPHYSLIARPGSRRYQNSTAWLLELLAVAYDKQPPSRARAYAMMKRWGFEPDVIRISYGKRVLGGLFAANTVFTDHPVATRLSGRYPVVTVRAIVRQLERVDAIAAQREWRNGREQHALGPI
jgi:hypothetical protein